MVEYNPETKTKRINIKDREKSYEDFYDRAFSRENIDEIYKRGGGFSLPDFMATIKGNTQRGYYDPIKNDYDKKQASRNLGKSLSWNIWYRFVEKADVKPISYQRYGKTQQRFQVAKGYSIGKYKAGMFISFKEAFK